MLQLTVLKLSSYYKPFLNDKLHISFCNISNGFLLKLHDVKSLIHLGKLISVLAQFKVHVNLSWACY